MQIFLKNQTFQLKIVIFIAVTTRCILHGRVFVMLVTLTLKNKRRDVNGDLNFSLFCTNALNSEIKGADQLRIVPLSSFAFKRKQIFS